VGPEAAGPTGWPAAKREAAVWAVVMWAAVEPGVPPAVAGMGAVAMGLAGEVAPLGVPAAVEMAAAATVSALTAKGVAAPAAADVAATAVTVAGVTVRAGLGAVMVVVDPA